MPYKCVHCSKLFDDGSKELIEGCSSCGRKFFFFIKKDKLEQLKNTFDKEIELTVEEKIQIEQDVREITGIKEDEDAPVFLDFESIKVVKQGKYLLDLSKLFSGKPQVYQLEDGKYIVDFVNVKNIDKKDQ